MSSGSIARGWHLLPFILLAVIQLTSTVTNQNHWPFCAYNMFHRVPPPQWIRPRVILKDDAGQVSIVEAHEVVPLEFFRAIGVLYTVYEDLPEPSRAAFSEYLLDKLNEGDWEGFDETFPSAQPAPGRRFVAIELAEVELDFSSHAVGGGVTAEKTNTLYRYGAW